MNRSGSFVIATLMDELAQTSNWGATPPTGTARGMALVASFESIVGQIADVSLEDGAVEQSNFHDYEPLRMPEMPAIDVHILEGADAPGGVGEPRLPPLLPAVANALYALDGRQFARLPLSVFP